MLSSAIKNLSIMEVGITEYFDESLNKFSRLLGLSNLEYENQKVSNRPKSNGLDEGTLSLIRENNELDYILYEFGKLKFEENTRKSGMFRGRESILTVNSNAKSAVDDINCRGEQVVDSRDKDNRIAISCPHCKETLNVTNRGNWSCPCCKNEFVY